MGFTTDEDSGENGRMPDIVAELIDIGVDYRQYDDGNEENRLIVIWKPENEVFGRQTSILSAANLLTVKPAARDIRVGGAENGFDIEIVGDVILKGNLGYKAGIWMKKLEDLGVKTPGETGNLRELIGTTAVISEKTYNETKGKPAKPSEKPFWIPIEIKPTTKKEDPAPEAEEAEHEKQKATLEEVLLTVAPGKDEKGLVAWHESSVYYNGTTAVPLFKAIAMLRDAGKLEVSEGVFRRGAVNLPGEEELGDDLPDIEDDLSPHSPPKTEHE